MMNTRSLAIGSQNVITTITNCFSKYCNDYNY